MYSNCSSLVGSSKNLSWKLKNQIEKASQLWVLKRCYSSRLHIITLNPKKCQPSLIASRRSFYSTKTISRIEKRSTSASASHTILQDQHFQRLQTEEESSITKNDTKSTDTNISSQLSHTSITLGEKCFLASFYVLTTIYDILTLPIYTAIDQPWTKIRLNKSQKSLPVNGEPWTFRALIPKAPLHQEMNQYNITTIPQLFTRAIEKHGTNECLGTRDLLKESDSVIDPNTLKSVTKYDLGEYKWKTYQEVDMIVNQITCGLTQMLNLKPMDKIGIFAETREEWFMLAMAAFKKNLTIVTVFTTLSNEGVIHALSETDITTLITSEEQLPRVREVLEKVPKINTIVCFENQKSSKKNPELPGVSFNWYSDLISTGTQTIPKEQGPTEEDMAIIMYTSGSTGVPKGVVLSHKNVIAGLQAAMDSCFVFGEAVPGDDAYIAYLPLAHVLELTSEAMSFIQGVRIGYSSANTLVDNSIGLSENTRGDCFVLKPTILPTVPLVLERVAKGIQDKISNRHRLVQLLFDYFYNYKLRWTNWGFETYLVNNIIFRRAKETFGGRIRFIVCGGAPLSKKTQEFIRTTLSSPIGLGYGMTETTSAAMITLAYDRQVGRAGTPITCNKIRLIDWQEGGYRVTDEPNPRGEVLIGGDNVAVGYFKRNDSDTFFTDSEGTRWVKSGDIAEVHSDNVFAIIDRKNDLVKLSNGEFISLGKIESTLKSISIVENVCIFANSETSHVVALIVPDRKRLEKITQLLGKPFDPDNIASVCEDKQIETAILHNIQKEGKDMKLSPVEIPKQIRLCSNPWTPESGLVTGSLKVKRANIHKEFDIKLKEMRNC